MLAEKRTAAAGPTTSAAAAPIASAICSRCCSARARRAISDRDRSGAPAPIGPARDPRRSLARATEVGWQATIPIEDTLTDLLDYWRHRVAVARVVMAARQHDERSRKVVHVAIGAFALALR